jgi:hypothetical protein
LSVKRFSAVRQLPPSVWELTDAAGRDTTILRSRRHQAQVAFTPHAITNATARAGRVLTASGLVATTRAVPLTLALLRPNSGGHGFGNHPRAGGVAAESAGVPPDYLCLTWCQP